MLPADFVDQLYNHGAKYIDNGLSIIPLTVETKQPVTTWKAAQTEAATIDDLERWCANGVMRPRGSVVYPFNLGLVTGALSGVVVIDCDDQAAMETAKEIGLWSPIRVITRRGVHLYFRHPGPGTHIKTVPNGLGWYKMDVKGDGGFVVLPPSVAERSGELFQYQWDCDVPWEEMPVLPNLASIPRPKTTADTAHGVDTLWDGSEGLDLSDAGVRWHGVKTSRETVWEKMKRITDERGKFSAGDGRNQWMVRFAGEQINHGVVGEDLFAAAQSFMDHFYLDHIEPEELARTLNSMMERDKQNHPERYDAHGNRLQARETQVPSFDWTLQALTPQNRASRAPSEAVGVYVDPIVPKGKFIQVHGAPGTGKSMVLLNMLYAASMGRRFANFIVEESPRVLYLDFDNPIDTMVERLDNVAQTYGEAENFIMFSRYDAPSQLNLRTADGLRDLGILVEQFKPDVLVIDSVRNAWMGLDENSADGWSQVNRVCGQYRQDGITVIIVHHSNKPDARTGKLGTAAGSLAQLTLIDLQVQIVRILGGVDPNDPSAMELLIQEAHQKNAVVNTVIYDRIRQQVQAHGATFRASYQIVYGKVRGDESNCNSVSIGLGLNEHDHFVWSGDFTNRAKAEWFHEHQGLTARDIALHLELPKRVVERWLGKAPRSIFDAEDHE